MEGATTGIGDEHHVQPKVVSITQATELGTCYTVGEVAALASWVHGHGMWLHLDGARLANAAAHFDVELGAFGAPAGVDVLSFGGTKNGAMGAEAVVVFRPQPETALPFIRKQSMQLASKMRFVAAQFVALLSDDLWKRNAQHANQMAVRLAGHVADIHGVEVVHNVEANAVFATVPGEVVRELQLRVPLPCLGRVDRSRALDVRVRHHRGGRRRVRPGGRQGDGRGTAALAAGPASRAQGVEYQPATSTTMLVSPAALNTSKAPEEERVAATMSARTAPAGGSRSEVVGRVPPG